MKRESVLPSDSLILNGFDQVHYADSFEISIQTEKSIDFVAEAIFNTSTPFDFLMKIRNVIVRLWGLKTSPKVENNSQSYYSVGSKLSIFTVIDRSESEIVMGENDKHLNFRTSVQMKSRDNLKVIILNTVVHYNNFWGRFYFFFVKPFHQLLILSILKKYKKRIVYCS